ncbi:MAG: LPXTG cell wall anchor domain-containing protein [Acutalibacteraceae bacterium]
MVAVVEILNNSGNQLPSTGGIGTYIFYFVGFALILTAAVLPLIRKYRKLHN